MKPMHRRAALALLAAPAALAQPEGIWQGYEGEWGHVSRQLIALAEAIPAARYSWRPVPAARSVSEVLMHIAISNFWLLSLTGVKLPAGLNAAGIEKTVVEKIAVLGWLRRSLEAVKSARASLSPAAFERTVPVGNRTAKVDGIYLRVIVHTNEHMGQLIAYARSMDIAPPWAEK